MKPKDLAPYLFEARAWLKKNAHEEGDYCFDYPDYGGLPKRISNALSSMEVDCIQESLDDIVKCRTVRSIEIILESFNPFS